MRVCVCVYVCVCVCVCVCVYVQLTTINQLSTHTHKHTHTLPLINYLKTHSMLNGVIDISDFLETANCRLHSVYIVSTEILSQLNEMVGCSQ